MRVTAHSTVREHYRRISRGHYRVWRTGVTVKPEKPHAAGCLGKQSDIASGDQSGNKPDIKRGRVTLRESFDPVPLAEGRYGVSDTSIGAFAEWCHGTWVAAVILQRETCAPDTIGDLVCTPDPGHARVLRRARFKVAGPDQPKCRWPDDSPVARAGKTMVFSATTELWGCVTGVGRRFLLAADVDGIDGSWNALHLAGSYAAYGAYEANNCSRYMTCPPGYQPTIFTGIVDLRTGAHHQSMGAEPVNDGALVVIRSGAAAWVISSATGYEVRAYDRHAGERALDSGPGIDPNSLRVSGSTVSWTNAGIRHSAQI